MWIENIKNACNCLSSCFKKIQKVSLITLNDTYFCDISANKCLKINTIDNLIHYFYQSVIDTARNNWNYKSF